MILVGGPVYMDTKFNKRLPSTDLSIDDYDPEKVAAAHSELGYKAAYIPYIHSSKTDLLMQTKQAFEKEKIVLAEMGCWKNMQSLNEYDRMQNIELMCEILASADQMGVSCIVNTIGSYSYGGITDDVNNHNFSDEFFETAVDTARYIINRVKPKHTKFTYENFVMTALDDIDQMEKMMKAVESDNFGIHLDATNLVKSVREFFSFNDIVTESFKRFGDKIVSCHIKDLQLIYPSLHVEIRERIPGEGMLDIAHYLNQISLQSHGIPTMLEHLDSEEDYTKARNNTIKMINQIEEAEES